MKLSLHKSEVAAVVFFVIFIADRVIACGEFRLPKDKFNGVNEYGAVSYWEQIGTIDLGEFKVPLNIGFQSDRNWSSKHLGGPGLWLGIADSVFLQQDSNSFEMLHPDGYTTSFGRDLKRKNVLHGGGGWKAEIIGDTITAWATCGWKLRFIKSRLAELSRQNRHFQVIRDSEGRMHEIREHTSSLLRLDFDPKTKLASSLKIGDRLIKLQYDTKPRIHKIAGQNIVSAMDTALSTMIFSDGKSKTFDFAVDAKLQPTLRISDSYASRLFTWNPDTQHILEDSWNNTVIWKYNIKPPQQKGHNAAIERINQEGEREFWHFDLTTATDTLETINGVKKIAAWFTSGALAGKFRSLTTYSSHGKLLSRRLYSYNDTGTLLRISNYASEGTNSEIRWTSINTDARAQQYVIRNGWKFNIYSSGSEQFGNLLTRVSNLTQHRVHFTSHDVAEIHVADIGNGNTAYRLFSHDKTLVCSCVNENIYWPKQMQ